MKYLSRVFFIFCTINLPLYADTLTLRADKWCPYNCDPNSDRPGFIVEIAKTVFEKHGHKVDYRLLNWARSIKETKEGKYSAIVGAAKDDAPGFIFPDLPLAQSEPCLWILPSSSWKYTGWHSLDSISKLGVTQDYTYQTEFDSYIKDPKNAPRIDVVSGDNPLHDNLNKILANRIQLFAEDKAVVLEHFFNLKQTQSVKEAVCLKGQEIFIAFSPKYPKANEMAALLGDGMKGLRKSGELNKILAKYGLKDWVNH